MLYWFKTHGFCGLTYIITTMKQILCGHLAIYNIVCFPNGGRGGSGGVFVLKIHFHITSRSIHFSSLFFFFGVNEPVGINTPDISLSFPFFLSSHTPLTSISTYHHHTITIITIIISISLPTSPREYTHGSWCSRVIILPLTAVANMMILYIVFFFLSFLHLKPSTKPSRLACFMNYICCRITLHGRM